MKRGKSFMVLEQRLGYGDPRPPYALRRASALHFNELEVDLPSQSCQPGVSRL